MANTKKLKPDARKSRKRTARKALKEFRASMTRVERKEFRKEEKLSLRVFLGQKREAAKAEAAKKEEAPAEE